MSGVSPETAQSVYLTTRQPGSVLRDCLVQSLFGTVETAGWFGLAEPTSPGNNVGRSTTFIRIAR